MLGNLCFEPCSMFVIAVLNSFKKAGDLAFSTGEPIWRVEVIEAWTYFALPLNGGMQIWGVRVTFWTVAGFGVSDGCRHRFSS
jgi:hypothetical protein